jgi:hypothetical protein
MKYMNYSSKYGIMNNIFVICTLFSSNNEFGNYYSSQILEESQRFVGEHNVALQISRPSKI